MNTFSPLTKLSALCERGGGFSHARESEAQAPRVWAVVEWMWLQPPGLVEMAPFLALFLAEHLLTFIVVGASVTGLPAPIVLVTVLENQS